MISEERSVDLSGSNPVCVFRTGDEELIAVVKSVLDEAGIRYVARTVELQELFGAGRGGGSFNFEVGSVDILVSADDADRARDVLGALRKGFLSGGGSGGTDSGE